MGEAYEAAGKILQAQMEQNPLLAGQMEYLKAVNPFVVPGYHDHIGRLLKHMSVNHEEGTLEGISAAQLGQRPVFVNCGTFPQPRRETIAAVRQYVEEGGTLITTDWALKYVLGPIFSDYVGWDGKKTDPKNESFPVEFPDPAAASEGSPSWFVEGVSYPLRIQREDLVKIIFQSREFGEKYQCSPALCVSFPVGKGQVFHYVSHLYAQMVELRTPEDAQPSQVFAGQQGVNPQVLGAAGQRVTSGGIKSAYSGMMGVVRNTSWIKVPRSGAGSVKDGSQGGSK